jgi:integrase/recombinase XerD
LTEIRNEDIDFDNGLVKFRHTKNKKIQFIPLNDHLLGVLEKFQFVRKGEPSDYLFCNSFGKKLLTNGIYSAIKRYNLSRGVFKTSTHLFRHTFAKNWIMEGGDIAKLQRMLGHETLEMSVHYANMYGINVLKNTEKFNLYSRLKQPDRIKLK